MNWENIGMWALIGATLANIAASFANYFWDVRIARDKAQILKWTAEIEAALIEAESRAIITNFARKLRIDD